MKNHFFTIAYIFISIAFLSSCKKEKTSNECESPTFLRVRLDVDPNQERLGNLGLPEEIPSGHGAQNPDFNSISAHYLELAPSAFTALGEGEILYHAPETDTGGESAIEFNQSVIVDPGGIFLEIPLAEIQAGNYEWVRLSLSYQNYNVSFRFSETNFTGTLASFVGFNTHIENLTISQNSIEINENKRQGFWAFETLGNISQGQAPEGATTVPNPLASSSPIPAGSCVVTGEFQSPLVITGNETEDIEITLSLSTNQSFEWIDSNENGFWDVGTGNAESVVDMGLRGLIPFVND